MAKASDNLFPYVHLVPAAAPASPAAGSQRLYLDSADSNKLKRKDSSGTVTAVEGAGGGGGGGGAVPKRSAALSSDFTSSTTGAYTAITGLSFTITPSAAGVLMMNAMVRVKSSGSGASLYLRSKVSPAPVTGDQYLGSSRELIPQNGLQTFPIVGNYDLASGTAYTITVEFYNSTGSITVDHLESYFSGVFLLY